MLSARGIRLRTLTLLRVSGSVMQVRIVLMLNTLLKALHAFMNRLLLIFYFFFLIDPATPEIYPLPLPDPLPISVPITHANADAPEACLAAARLAMMYREKFHGDVVIDIVGYRRHGHNEGDEPAYTQPVMYE